MVPSKGEAAWQAGHEAGFAAGLVAGREAERSAGRVDELEDVLALLDQQIENAGLMVSRSPEFADYARDRQRQLEVLADDLKGGRHHGMAAVRADLKRMAEEGATDSVTPLGGAALASGAKAPGMTAPQGTALAEPSPSAGGGRE